MIPPASSSGILSPPVEWNHTFGGEVSDYLSSLHLTKTGSYVLTGNTWSRYGDVVGYHDPEDSWILRGGDIWAFGIGRWNSCFGGTDVDLAPAGAPTRDGGSVIAGYTGSNNGDVIGHGDWINHSWPNYPVYPWVVKVGTDGTIQWQKCPGEFSGNVFISGTLNSIQETSDGKYITGGSVMREEGICGAVFLLNRTGDMWQRDTPWSAMTSFHTS
jgi:hypothetical protein